MIVDELSSSLSIGYNICPAQGLQVFSDCWTVKEEQEIILLYFFEDYFFAANRQEEF